MNEIQNEKLGKLTELILQTSQNYFPNGGKRFKLKPNEKIQFALDYYDIMGEISLIDVYAELAVDDCKAQKIIKKFIIDNRFTKYYPSAFYSTARNNNPIAESINLEMLGPASIIREYDHQNWLEILDEEALFEENKIKHPVYRVYLDQNGTPIKFNKEKAKTVKLAIMDQNIVPARCIVEGAYPYFAGKTMPSYIQKIKSMKGDKKHGTK